MSKNNIYAESPVKIIEIKNKDKLEDTAIDDIMRRCKEDGLKLQIFNEDGKTKAQLVKKEDVN